MVMTRMRLKNDPASAFLRITLFVLGLMVQLACSLSSSAKTTTYNYFAIGSNMHPATMTALRGIRPLNASAAVLPDFQLAFDIAGSPQSTRLRASTSQKPLPLWLAFNFFSVFESLTCYTFRTKSTQRREACADCFLQRHWYFYLRHWPPVTLRFYRAIIRYHRISDWKK